MNDGDHLGLIYEYMARGNLAEHLSGNLLALATRYMLQHMLHNPIYEMKMYIKFNFRNQNRKLKHVLLV